MIAFRRKPMGSAEKEDSRPSYGAFAFRMVRCNAAVTFRSEAAWINLNLAFKELFTGLFAGLGAPYSAAQYCADRIVGWCTNWLGHLIAIPLDPESKYPDADHGQQAMGNSASQIQKAGLNATR
jgi:hypothetical protein